MKLKILPLIVVLILFFTSINGISLGLDNENDVEISQETSFVSFSELSVEKNEDSNYFSLNIDEATTYLFETGKPVMPAYIQTFVYPRGTKIIDINFELSDIKSKKIDGKIKPSPEPVPRLNLENIDSVESVDVSVKQQVELIEDESVYLSSELYPNSWYDYKICSGLIDGQDSVILKITTYPVRYSPLEDTVYKIDKVDVEISYKNDPNIEPFPKDYDLLILTPKKFKLWLIPLFLHKTRMGVATKIQDVESIYPAYPGRDEAEKIKNYVKYAKEEWGIKYLLLFGGLKSHMDATDREKSNLGSQDWHIPVRYVRPDMWEHGHISDLYYADLYKNGGTEFEDWDSNGNDIFVDGVEDVDMYPDVYYGRLPCRNFLEVRTLVKKIIKYEKPTILNRLFGKPWMKKMIAVGGQTFNFYEGQPDGEWLCDQSIENMGDLITEPVKVYASNKDTINPQPVPEDIIYEYSKGAGFVLFQGHGSAHSWDTHWAEYEGQDDWAGPFSNFQMPALKNRHKLPIVVVGGCHNGIFNVTLIKSINDALNLSGSQYHTYGVPTMNCYSWRLVVMRNRGAISSTGCTDYGIGNPSYPYSLSGALESNFFYSIGQDKVKNLGDAHSGSIIKYLDENAIAYDDEYAITEYQLFGDPSLRIGGY